MKLYEYISRLFVPPSCACCKTILDIDNYYAFCDKCHEQLRSIVFDSIHETYGDCVDKCYYYYKYRSWYSKNVVRHAKYVSSKAFLEHVGRCGKESLKKHNLLQLIDVITFSPRRVMQKRIYGFDQSEELAKAISKATYIPCEKLLKRKGLAYKQKALNRNQRTKNVKGKFVCTSEINGKTVLLIDDVVTTGSTVNECASELKKHGAKAVYVWALAAR